MIKYSNLSCTCLVRLISFCLTASWDDVSSWCYVGSIFSYISSWAQWLSISSCCVCAGFQRSSCSVAIIWSSTMGSWNKCLSDIPMSLIGASGWDRLCLISLISSRAWNRSCLIGLLICWRYSLIIWLINLISCGGSCSISLDKFTSLTSNISFSFRIVNNLSLNR